MMCLQCGAPFVCPCNSCKKRNSGQIRWKWLGDDIEACGVCGLEALVDSWFDEQFIQDRNRINSHFKHHRMSLKRYLMRPGKNKNNKFLLTSP